MKIDFTVIRQTLETLRSRGVEYFNAIQYVGDVSNYPIGLIDSADDYFSLLEEENKQTSTELHTELLRVVKQIANCMKYSSLLTEADRRDLSTWIKSLRASLRLKQYEMWDTEVLHDEDRVLGVVPAGQSDTKPIRPSDASRNFNRDILNLLNLVDLLDISLILPVDEFRTNPQVTADYKPNSAFVMMQINLDKPELEDVYEKIKYCFSRFRITVLRADEIEHEGIITQRILEEIKSSEFLLADLTGERPSVYYEIGYAHSLGRSVIMYRSKDTKVHFDLAAYNCPEYKNITDLGDKLLQRLETITNRKPQGIDHSPGAGPQQLG